MLQFTANCRVPGIPVSLHPLDLLDKMVKHRRGGFCYENNVRCLCHVSTACSVVHYHCDSR